MLDLNKSISHKELIEPNYFNHNSSVSLTIREHKFILKLIL